jgi:tetratricopeptide (TPR) repeat protein
VISQGVDFVETFFQVEALQERVRLALKENPDDAQALARRGELEFAAGKLDASIASLRRSFELDPNALTRELYVRSLLEGLRTDFAAHRELVEEADRLAERPERRAELVRLLAVGLQKEGEIDAAFKNYLKLIDLGEGDDPLDEVDARLSVRRSRWIQAQLVSLRAAADAAGREKMDAAVARRYEQLGETPTSARLRAFLDHFGGYELANAARLRLAARLLEEGETLECELLLTRLLRSDDAGRQRAATALFARLLRGAGRVEDAAIYYRRLAGPLADVVCLDGKTGRELVAALRPDGPLAEALDEPRRWPRGEVVASTGKAERGGRAQRRLYPIELRDQLGPFQRGRAIAFDQQSQSVVGHGALGEVEYRIPLNAPGARRGAFVNPSLNYGKARGHLLVISMGNQIMALDTLNTRRADWQNVLWREDLSEQLPGVTTRRRMQVKRVNLPGGGVRFQAEDGQGHPLGVLGPVTSRGVVFQRFRSLRAVDPLTGETLWIRRDVPVGCALFGDATKLVAVPPDSTEALIFDPLDGALLGKRPVPPLGERLATVGPHVLRLDNSTPEGPTLTLLDLWSQKVLWRRAFAVGAKFRRLGDDLLGAMQRDGKFALLALADGRPLVEEQLLEEPQLVDIYLQQSRERFLLVTNHPPVETKEGVNISAAPGGLNNPLISGRVYAFDRTTGEPQWPTPAVIERHGLLLPQPSALPVLVFVRHVINPTAGGRNRTKTSLLCLDKRTGRAVFQKDDFAFGTGFFHLEGDRAANIVAVRLPSLAVKLHYTETPIPPEPPLQAGQGYQRPPKRALGVFGSMFRALGRAAAEVQGERLDDLQVGNPFAPFGGAPEVQRIRPAQPAAQEKKEIKEAGG